MIITRTPYRISFFGGGTDYPTWYCKNGGAVLATTINKYCYITCRYLPPFFEHRHRIVYSRIESCKTVDEILHPSARAVLTYKKIERGVEIHHDGDLPARSGMGSSSAFTVGLLHALYALKGQIVDKQRLCEESIYIEQELLKETVGSQDQASAAFGGLNHIIFPSDGKISVKPIPLTSNRLNELNSYLMLFYTGIKRTAADVAETYVNNIEAKEKQLCKMMDFVEEGISIVTGKHDLKQFGKLLHEAWQVKRTFSDKVSNSEVDDLYEISRKAGAIGGKLTGAGGGGFLLLFVPPSRKKKVQECLKNLIYVPLKIDFSGSQVIFFDPQEDYSLIEKERDQKNIKKFRELSD
jgi:D-glycero-alpha-D-manno-heptose-7-phosphate kinase